MDGQALKIRRLPAVDENFLGAIHQRFKAWDPRGKIFLFGSRAKNTHSYYSDYDLLFLSDQFGTMTESERYRLILERVRIPKSEWDIEPHCYTEEEWNSRKGSLFYKEVESVAKLVSG